MDGQGARVRLRPSWWDRVDEDAVQKTGKGVGVNYSDPYFQLSVMTHHWGAVFGKTLGKAERNYVGELLEVRNRWAHPKADQPFSSSDTERALDTMARLATAISAPDQAKQLGAMRGAILRAAWEAAQKQEQKRQVTLPLEGAAAPGLRPWRDVIEPHPDVAAGRFAQAEFAADLGQVARGEAGDEYGNPRRFFERTFLTAGLSDLLITGLRRLAGRPEGDPVVELQTNFGGGKTHSMLALYHLVSGDACERAARASSRSSRAPAWRSCRPSGEPCSSGPHSRRASRIAWTASRSARSGASSPGSSAARPGTASSPRPTRTASARARTSCATCSRSTARRSS